jgi:hypothetical protein
MPNKSLGTPPTNERAIHLFNETSPYVMVCPSPPPLRNHFMPLNSPDQTPASQNTERSTNWHKYDDLTDTERSSYFLGLLARMKASDHTAVIELICYLNSAPPDIRTSLFIMSGLGLPNQRQIAPSTQYGGTFSQNAPSSEPGSSTNDQAPHPSKK